MWQCIKHRTLFGIVVLLVMTVSVTPKRIHGDKDRILKKLKELKLDPSHEGSYLEILYVSNLASVAKLFSVSSSKNAFNERKGIIWDKTMQLALQGAQEEHQFDSIRIGPIAGYESEFKVSIDVRIMEFDIIYPLDELRPNLDQLPIWFISIMFIDDGFFRKNSRKPTRLEFPSEKLKVLNLRCPDNNFSLIDHLSFSDSVEEFSVNAGSLSDFAFFLFHYTHLKTYRLLNTLEANRIERNHHKVIEVQVLNPDIDWDGILKWSKTYTTLDIVLLSGNTASSSESIPPQKENNVFNNDASRFLLQLKRTKFPARTQRPRDNETTSSNPPLQEPGAAREPNSTLPNDSAPSKPSEPHPERELSTGTTLDPASPTHKWLKEEPVLHADPTVDLVLRLSILIGVCFLLPIVALCIYRWALSSYHANVDRSEARRVEICI